MPASLAVPKFIGTTTLGLLTGLSLSTLQTYPTLLLLPSATHCSRTFSVLSAKLQRLTLSLSGLSALSFLSAFALSSPRTRHPYLLWTTALTVLAAGPDAMRLARAVLAGGPSTVVEDGDGTGATGSVTSTSVRHSDDEDWVAEDRGVNGEEVEKRVQTAVRREAMRTIVLGAAFGVGVIGLWGDGA